MIDTKEKLIDLSDTGLSDAELFASCPQDASAVEKITAPRYSYWKSVGRVFFHKKSNIVVLLMLAIILVFTFIYPDTRSGLPEVRLQHPLAVWYRRIRPVHL